jgi:hypothetical protein
MFNRAGVIKVKITGFKIAEPKFAQPPAFDVCLRVEEEATGEGDWWHGEMSNNFGKGTFSGMPQHEITTKKLRSLGWKGNNLAKIGEELIGVETNATVEASKDGKYFNLKFIGGGGAEPEDIDPSTLAARIKAIMGGAAAAAPAAAPRPSAPMAAPAASPFDEPVAADAADVNFNPFG